MPTPFSIMLEGKRWEIKEEYGDNELVKLNDQFKIIQRSCYGIPSRITVRAPLTWDDFPNACAVRITRLNVKSYSEGCSIINTWYTYVRILQDSAEKMGWKDVKSDCVGEKKDNIYKPDFWFEDKKTIYVEIQRVFDSSQPCFAGKAESTAWFEVIISGLEYYYYKLTVKVVNQWEAGIEGATVNVRDPDTGELVDSEKTDYSGIAQFTLCEGKYLVEAISPDGKKCGEEKVDLSSDKYIELSCIIGVPKRYDVTIYVKEEGGGPIEGASVYLKGPDERSGVTDKTGTVEFKDVAEGKYELIVQKEGYERYSEELDINRDIEITVELVPTTALYTLTVCVRWEDTGEPAKGVLVRALEKTGRPASSCKTGNDGCCGMKLSSGIYDIEAAGQIIKRGVRVPEEKTVTGTIKRPKVPWGIIALFGLGTVLALALIKVPRAREILIRPVRYIRERRRE